VVKSSPPTDRNTGKSRGFGHVYFSTAEAIEAALALNGKEFDDRPVNIDKSQPVDKSKVHESRAKTFGNGMKARGVKKSTPGRLDSTFHNLEIIIDVVGSGTVVGL
jgi:RNA recognition motif-containing protein